MTRGERNIAWMERFLIVPDGELEGQPFRLLPYQREFTKDVYDNPHGTRLAILSIPRKGGKTTYLAAIMLLHMVGPERNNRKKLRCFSAAMTRDQAAMIYEQMEGMINQSDILTASFKCLNTTKIVKLTWKGHSIQFKSLSSDAASKFGLIPDVVAFDELGQERKDHNPLYSAIRTAGIRKTGRATNFIQFIISTQAGSDEALLSTLIDRNKDNPRAVIRVHSAPADIEDEEMLSVEAWKKYHPGYGYTIDEEAIEDEIHNAKQSISALVEYKNLYMNLRIDTRASAFDPMDIAKCAIPLKGLQVPKDIPIYLGLDPSRTQDLTALVAVFEMDGKPTVYPFIWCPDHNLEKRLAEEKIDYKVMAEKGWVQLSEGRSINFAAVAAQIDYIFKNYNVIQLCFDNFYFAAIKAILIANHGFLEEDFGTINDVHAKFRPFTYGYQSSTAPLVELQNAVKHQDIQHNSNPLLVQHLINSVVVKNKSGDYILNKDKLAASQRIDSAASLVMAYSSYMAHFEKAPEYGSFDDFLQVMEERVH